MKARIANGLYNVLFSEDEHADLFLDLLDLDRAMFGRYRDCYLNEDGTKIIVLTRCGGPNREDYKIVFDHMKEHRNYLGCYDDQTDETYCYFEFGVPLILQEKTKPLATGVKPMTVGEKFEKEIEEMNKPGSEAEKRAKEVAETINKQIKAQPNGGVIFIGDPDLIDINIESGGRN